MRRAVKPGRARGIPMPAADERNHGYRADAGKAGDVASDSHPEPESKAEIDETWDAGSGAAGSTLIYCGLCGALNPASNFYCAACGTTLVDAFHATEGLRVFERPDPAARLIEILPAGGELDVVADAAAPADWVRIRLPYGRLGYVRAADAVVASAPAQAATIRPPDINTNARGCVTSGAALWALALLVVTALFGVAILARARPQDAGLLGLVFCVTLGPLILLTIGAYVAARTREDQLADEEAALETLARSREHPGAQEVHRD
jgi:hypothetical protein